MAGKAVLAAALLLAGAAHAGTSYGDWNVTCPDGKPCMAEQINQNRKSGKTVMRTDIAPVKGGFFVQVQVPSAVRLDEGPWLTVDGVFVTALKYETCTDGCVARVALPAARASALTQGKSAMVTVTGLDGRRIGIPLMPTGLDKALAAISKKK